MTKRQAIARAEHRAERERQAFAVAKVKLPFQRHAHYMIVSEAWITAHGPGNSATVIQWCHPKQGTLL